MYAQRSNAPICVIDLITQNADTETIHKRYRTVTIQKRFNLSSADIPGEVQGLLQLGDNFCLPIGSNEKAIVEMVKNIEHNIRRLPIGDQIAIRNRSAPIINKMAGHSFGVSEGDETLIRAANITKEFLRENPNVIFTRADKGNVTVALDREIYLKKMTDMFSDESTYLILSKNPIRKMINGLHELLVRWKSHNYISDMTYKRLNCTDGVLPRAYGLPKIHKPNCPFRVIVSSINTPLYQLAAFLHNIIYDAIPRAHSHVANSFELVKKLSGVQLNDHFKLLSLDVVSLFTNIPLDLALDGVLERWCLIKEKCSIPRDEFLTAVRFILNSTFFTFNGKIYQQTFGTPMGSPLSPLIADITLQDLENKAIGRVPFNLPFYYRYVDDIALAAPSSMFNEVLGIFNSFHPRLQFTLEEGVDNKLNFLDVTIIVNNNLIEFDWYHKPTFSGRYLNYKSNHPLCHKRGTIVGLVDRAFLLSHPRFHQKNFELIVGVLLDNGYPLFYIFHVIRERLKLLLALNQTGLEPNEDHSEKRPSSYFTIPYIPTFSEQFKRVLRNHDTGVSYFGLNKLRNFVKVHKDIMPKDSCNNVVYKVSCNDCDASYVGQTGRQLKKRISEHRNHIRRNTSQPSVITNHRLEFGHDFNWEESEILDRESSLGKRLVSEMLFIKRQKNSLNLQSDTEGLHHTFATIIDNLSKI